jgi:hypothetical protein
VHSFACRFKKNLQNHDKKDETLDEMSLAILSKLLERNKYGITNKYSKRGKK